MSDKENKKTEVVLQGRLKAAQETPGPDTYNLRGFVGNSRHGPTCTISHRNRLRGSDPCPGPNIYSLPPLLWDRVPHRKGASAVVFYSKNEKFGFAHDYAKTPGPAAYTRPDNGNRRKPPEITMKGPGPAIYALPPTIGANNHAPNKQRAPAFSLGVRRDERYPGGPGPVYNVNGMTSKGSSFGRTATLKGRLKELSAQETPGPGTYNLRGSVGNSRNGPTCTISHRNRLREGDTCPGPNVYSLPSLLGDRVPHRKGAPAVVFYGKNEKFGFAHDYAKTPGPAAYTRPDNGNTRKPPEVTMKGRNFMPSAKNSTPGPGTYKDTFYHLKQSPRPSMGVRHSELSVPCIVDVED